MKLSGRRALITGASRGIGRGIAVGFASEGAAVAVHFNSHEAEAFETARICAERGAKAVTIRADVGDADQVAAMVDSAWNSLGGIDILVNNAGIAFFTAFLDLPLSQWRRVMAVNLEGVMVASQRTARRMVEAGIRGKIINISSINGFQVEKEHLDYNVSKAGLDMLTKSMAVELGPLGITVNGLAPDIVYTDIIPEGFWEKAGAAFIRKTPLGRKATVEDCVGTMIYLASDAADYLNGHTIVLDGGMSITQL